MNSTKSKRNRKRKLPVSSDSDEDLVKTTKINVNAPRQSSRIYDKQHKPEFRRPSRDEVWNKISSMKSVVKLKKLTPRKTVNNFTKVYNDYNFDDYEDTSDDEVTSVESSDSDDKKKRQHRIKNFHKRLQVQSSSTDEDGDNLNKHDKVSFQIYDALSGEQDSKDTDCVKDNVGVGLLVDDKFDSDKAIDGKNADLEDSDESEVHYAPSKRSTHVRNHSILESDEENENSEKNNDDGEDSKTLHSSDSSDPDSSVVSSKCRFANQKMKQSKLFQEFREAQAKRKKGISS